MGLIDDDLRTQPEKSDSPKTEGKRLLWYRVRLSVFLICLVAMLIYLFIDTFGLFIGIGNQVVQKKYWPPELTDLLTEVDPSGSITATIEVRSVGMITEYCWKIPASDQLVAAHMKHFNLATVGIDGVEFRRVQSKFPRDWDGPVLTDVELFASTVKYPDTGDVVREVVLMHDRNSEMIYFYYYFDF